LRRESGRDFSEFIRDADGRVYVGKSKVRVDLSHNYEFGTDIEDPIFVVYSALVTVKLGDADLPRETEAWNADLEERDGARTDGACEVG
jgi:hypothetical protein